MKFLWQNKDNPHFNHEDFKVSAHYKWWQRILITFFVIIVIPVMLIAYPLYKFVGGAIFAAVQFGFYLGERCFVSRKGDPAFHRFQFVRSYISAKAARLTHINGSLRKMLYRLSGIKVGKAGFIGAHGVFDDVFPENVIVEDNVTISFDVTIVAHGPKERVKNDADKMVIFREKSYVGAKSLILPGVEIGSYAIVGAGSVVTKDVPPGAVVGGAPARILYYREGFGPDAEKKEE